MNRAVRVHAYGGPEAVSIDQVKAASTEASGRASLKVRTRAQCGKILRAMVGAAPA